LFKIDTISSGRQGAASKARFIKGLAVAAGLAMALVGTQAAAYSPYDPGSIKDVILNGATMDQSHWAIIDGFGAAYSNGVTFNVTDVAAPNENYTIYGFCVDIYHDMYVNQPLGYEYVASTLTTDHHITDATPNGAPLSPDQIAKVATLVDIGTLLNRYDLAIAGVSTRLAAIQAAIWEIENPGKVTLYTDNISDGAFYTEWYNYYVNITPDPTAKMTTIVDTAINPAHQSFAIGWPVPEPATWAMMLIGFFGMGAMLRSRRAAAAA
jgi:hypothetical protein